ncbi:hypothetical protein RHGRI_013188 [Rhododendron griersonianum]|uniref:Mitochondrial import inner membrane translocase subunit Tim17/Tim22/Tim23 family protein n=1 Tax=Rhododendron griersonianum TaxID=479676 RepID=A0AAV6K505_9ERIC|nr:hypothetical protein RHGRI_013188 [Rhododendron griersonianum]
MAAPPSTSSKASATPPEATASPAQAVRMNAPSVGGSFAVWGGLFSAFCCTLDYARQREDPWNSIAAAAATGGLLRMRRGLRAASRSALAGGVLLALMEGSMIMLTGFDIEQQYMPVVIEDETPNKSSETTSSIWFGGRFGGKMKGKARGFKTEVSESSDSPLPPTFEFK